MYSPTVAVLSSLVYTLVACLNGTDLKHYHFDELGSTLFLTDASGVQTDKYVYNTWGKVVSSNGSTVNPYKYIGRLGYYHDVLTGLDMLGKRSYDPEAGVFTQRDSAKDGLSFYAYTSGKVMTAVDPWGEVCMVDLYTHNRRFGSWIFEHSLLYFPRRCKDNRTAGLYPNGTKSDVRIPDEQHSEYPQLDSGGKERAIVRKCNNDPVFENFMDQCIKESKDGGAKWQYFPYNCWAWTRDMWASASAKYGNYKQCILSGGNPEVCKEKANTPLVPIIIAGVQ